jgi:hypothetical protein
MHFSKNFKKWKSYEKGQWYKKIKNACTIDERFGRPWQALKGISIKIIYVRKLSYPTTKKYINLKGLPNKKFHAAVLLTQNARFLRSKIDHISANSKQNSKRHWPVDQGPRGYCLMKKTEGRKSRGTVPLSQKRLKYHVTVRFKSN